MEISNVEEILLDPHLEALPFSLSMDTEPTSGRWRNWILVIFMFSPLGMWRLIVLTSIYATDLWMEHVFPKRIIKTCQDLGQLSLIPGGKLFPIKTSPSYPDSEYPIWLKISRPNSFCHLNVQFVPQDLEYSSMQVCAQSLLVDKNYVLGRKLRTAVALVTYLILTRKHLAEVT